MPLGKYYCDYYDKKFQDTPFHRKRHIQGIHHQKAKALWYASIPLPPHRNQTSLIPTATDVCNHFIRTGSCPYANSCKYIHPIQNMNMQTVANNMDAHLPMSQPIERSSLPGGMPGNLPPSLRPPPEGGGYPHLPFVDWG